MFNKIITSISDCAGLISHCWSPIYCSWFASYQHYENFYCYPRKSHLMYKITTYTLNWQNVSIYVDSNVGLQAESVSFVIFIEILQSNIKLDTIKEHLWTTRITYILHNSAWIGHLPYRTHIIAGSVILTAQSLLSTLILLIGHVTIRVQLCVVLVFDSYKRFWFKERIDISKTQIPDFSVHWDLNVLNNNMHCNSTIGRIDV